MGVEPGNAYACSVFRYKVVVFRSEHVCRSSRDTRPSTASLWDAYYFMLGMHKQTRCLTCAAAARSSSTCSWSRAMRPSGGSRRCLACWLRPRRRCPARRAASPGAGPVRVLLGFRVLPPSSLAATAPPLPSAAQRVSWSEGR